MATYRIAVLGAGNIGGTLGRKWIAAGHQVAFGVNNTSGEHAQQLRTDVRNDVTIGTIASAIPDADVVLFAIPGNSMEEAISANATALDGKLIIDAANRRGNTTANSLAFFQQYTPNARVFRAFNSLAWEVFANPDFNGLQADLFFAGDPADRSTVEQLIGDIGLRPIFLGGADQIPTVDSVLGLFFALVAGQKRGRHLAFKVLE
ncbi:MAG TPA: NAD(P)-binding domain-containing protein [Ktedonobacterales bacterium]|nr:NAD(P)-binding domain-containing protein [Ktedonobacterales bacterium]